MGVGVSIVVTYRKNKYRFLGECLKAIKDQTMRVNEVVIIEDCIAGETCDPPDMIAGVCEEYLDQEIYTIVQADHQIGKAAQINRGVERATQEYVGLCSADDYYEPAFVEESMRALAKPEAEVSWTNYNVVDDMRTVMYHYDAVERAECTFATDQEFLDKATEWGATHGMFSCLATWFAKRQLFLEVPFDEELKLNEDLEWLLRAALVDRRRFVYVRKVLANYRISATQASNTLSNKRLQLHNRYTWAKLNMLLGKDVFTEPQGPIEP